MNTDRPGCISCDTLHGRHQSPGGLLRQNQAWAFFLGGTSLLTPGLGFIVLRRHAESLAGLTDIEQSLLGPMVRDCVEAMTTAFDAERVHVAPYGEGVGHVHFHVLPRTADLPAGNIPLTLLSSWYRLLARLRLKRPPDEATVAEAAARLQIQFRRISDAN